jgi:hypothetical protein
MAGVDHDGVHLVGGGVDDFAVGGDQQAPFVFALPQRADDERI